MQGDAVAYEDKRALRGRMRLTLMLLASVALLGCASNFSIIDGSEYVRTDPNSAPVVIRSVDQQGFENSSEARIDPGPHLVVLLSQRLIGRRDRLAGDPNHEFTLPVNAQACKRYLISAEHRGTLSKDWDPVLMRTEDIPGCTPK